MLRRWWSRRRETRTDDRGVSTVEYALLAGAFGIAVIGGLSVLESNLETADDDRQAQFGTPHATNQTTTTASGGPTSSSSTTTTAVSTTTSTTVVPTTAPSTTTTTSPSNLSNWSLSGQWCGHPVYWCVRATGTIYYDPPNQACANCAFRIRYFDANESPIFEIQTTTNASGGFDYVSPQFTANNYQQVFSAVTHVNGNSAWGGTLTGWTSKPAP